MLGFVSGVGRGEWVDTFAVGIREIVVVNVDSSRHYEDGRILSYVDMKDVFSS